MYKIIYKIYRDEENNNLKYGKFKCVQCDYPGSQHNMCVFTEDPKIGVPKSYWITHSNKSKLFKRDIIQLVMNALYIIRSRRKIFFKTNFSRIIENIRDENLNKEFEIVI